MRTRARFEREIQDLLLDRQGRAWERELDVPRERTLYLPIRLNDTVPEQVGVFIPRSFQPTSTVDLIVYFHGHIIPACKTDAKEFLAKGMEYYWSTPLFRCLRDEVTASGARAILVAPMFVPIFASKKSSARDYGNLNEAGKLDFLIGETLAQLIKRGALPAGAQAARIILSGHSGGGLPMLKILETKNALKPNIAECWGFECLYFGTSGWKAWLSANPDKAFRHFRRPTQFDAPAAALKPLRNFFDVKDGRDHCTIVKEKWREAIDTSGVLRGDQKVVGSGRAPAARASSASNGAIAASPRAGDFALTGWKLKTAKIVVAREGDKKKGTEVIITEAPAVFLPEIITMARNRALKDKRKDIADKLDPATWFKQFTRITFLGRSLKSGQYLHLEMAKSLKTIEAQMVANYGGDARSVGDMLLNKSPEGIAGSRLVSGTATFSMHMFGLAVDVNYLGNPFIQSASNIKALNAALKNAALLLNKPRLEYTKVGGGAAKLFDKIQELDATLERYFGLLGSPGDLQSATQRSQSSEWNGLSPAQARRRIQKDLDGLAGALHRTGTADGYFKKDEALDKKEYFKKHAILDFDKRFVVDMEKGGLHWGAAYGDMMHFDMRSSGVGAYIEKARLAYSGAVKALAKKHLSNKQYGTHAPAAA
jgi:hypothetical protein